MKSKTLTKFVQLRISPELKGSIENEASRLGLRETDVIRLAIALMLRGKNPSETFEQSKNKDTI